MITVNGGYSSWSAYEECSVSCGIGIEKRSRYCSDPKPAFGGEMCSHGMLHTETRPCRKPACASKFGYSFISFTNNKNNHNFKSTKKVFFYWSKSNMNMNLNMFSQSLAANSEIRKHSPGRLMSICAQ